MTGGNVTDKERIKALEDKVFGLSQLVYALAAASSDLPQELRDQFKLKHNVRRLERIYEK